MQKLKTEIAELTQKLKLQENKTVSANTSVDKVAAMPSQSPALFPSATPRIISNLKRMKRDVVRELINKIDMAKEYFIVESSTKWKLFNSKNYKIEMQKLSILTFKMFMKKKSTHNLNYKYFDQATLIFFS